MEVEKLSSGNIFQQNRELSEALIIKRKKRLDKMQKMLNGYSKHIRRYSERNLNEAISLKHNEWQYFPLVNMKKGKNHNERIYNKVRILSVEIDLYFYLQKELDMSKINELKDDIRVVLLLLDNEISSTSINKIDSDSDQQQYLKLKDKHAPTLDASKYREDGRQLNSSTIKICYLKHPIDVVFSDKDEVVKNILYLSLYSHTGKSLMMYNYTLKYVDVDK